MCVHENKVCPKCSAGFECKVGTINLCQCSTISLSEAERGYIESLYTDCLCANCLNKLKDSYHQSKKLQIAQVRLHR
ncbi:cysteine-rich CWC family protein [Ferruginibacter lapsinanis]|uniref:cysteine-rich CWC family protein n=1 Tax=Ferruginibacter lapsinanis TaxID=563172 RepID=UPI001E59BBF7|nr:cysteine-rich CWC family protein [Ferruginibacter lapsinanis]UEG51036.1 cysteine-rich CWC family protein [Ferruginibacter lapsinanis]